MESPTSPSRDGPKIKLLDIYARAFEKNIALSNSVKQFFSLSGRKVLNDVVNDRPEENCYTAGLIARKKTVIQDWIGAHNNNPLYHNMDSFIIFTALYGAVNYVYKHNIILYYIKIT